MYIRDSPICLILHAMHGIGVINTSTLQFSLSVLFDDVN